MRLAAGLPLGELERSPRPPSRNWWVPASKGKEGGGRKGRGAREVNVLLILTVKQFQKLVHI